LRATAGQRTIAIVSATIFMKRFCRWTAATAYDGRSSGSTSLSDVDSAGVVSGLTRERVNCR
jgi:hypothetical protein